MNSSSGQLSIGCQFGRFRIVRFLGKGGMGEVYEAEHEDLGSSFAIKLINQDIMDDAGVQLRFKKEARTNFGLKHRNIVSVDDCNEVEGKYYIRMQLVKGMVFGDRTAVNLDEYVSLCGGKLPEQEVAKILKDILLGLKEAHDRGIIHRDLKPANILMEKGHALLSDFGLAKLVGEEFFQSRIRLSIEESKTIVRKSGETGTEGMGSLEASYVGTYDFMAPEVKTGSDATKVSDLFAVGLIAYQLLTGTKSLGLKKPTELVPGINPQWDDWISGATDYDPVLRTQSVDELLKKLPLLGEEQPGKRKKRFFFSKKALFLYFLMAAGGSGYYFYKHLDEYPLLETRLEEFIDLVGRLQAAILEDEPLQLEPESPIIAQGDTPVIIPQKELVVDDEPEPIQATKNDSVKDTPVSSEVEPVVQNTPTVDADAGALNQTIPIVTADPRVASDAEEPLVEDINEPFAMDNPATDDADVVPIVIEPVVSKVMELPTEKSFGFPKTLDLELPNGMQVNFILCEFQNRKFYISTREVSEELYDYIVVKRDGMRNSPNYPVRLYEVEDLTHFFEIFNEMGFSGYEPLLNTDKWIARLPSVSEWLNLYQTYKNQIPVAGENVGNSAFIPVDGDDSVNSPIKNLVGNASEICVLDRYAKYKILKSDHLRAYGLSYNENYTSDFHQYGRRLPGDRESLWRMYGFRILIETKANKNK